MIEAIQSQDIWTITINRPEKANALTEDMLVSLIHAFESAKNAKAVILTGVGDVFSAGADLGQAKEGLATSPLWEKLSSAVECVSGLTICALNGTLAGGAFGMALACDLRIAAPHARFFYPVMKHGYLPQPSDPIRMSHLIGPARTKLIMLAGQKIDSEEALAFGLIDRIVSASDILKTANSLCDDVFSAKLETIFAIKSLCPLPSFENQKGSLK